MIPTSPICNVCEYSQEGDKCPPTAEQAARGLNPLGAVPAQLWNSLWHDANAAANCIKFASDTLMCEINSVLAEAGISPDALCTNQLASAITCLLQTIDPNGGKSSVKSSTTPGMVSIDNNGYMTANCVGNANSLTTTNRVIVDAVNEINTNYGNAYDTLWQNTYDTEEAKADNNHASCETCYGVGTASVYGHLKISDVCCAVLPDCGNVAASQKALADIWAYVNSTTGLGNTLACPLSTGAAGTCTTAARSDHVHPIPAYVSCACSLVLNCSAGLCFQPTQWVGYCWLACALGNVRLYICNWITSHSGFAKCCCYDINGVRQEILCACSFGSGRAQISARRICMPSNGDRILMMTGSLTTTRWVCCGSGYCRCTETWPFTCYETVYRCSDGCYRNTYDTISINAPSCQVYTDNYDTLVYSVRTCYVQGIPTGLFNRSINFY